MAVASGTPSKTPWSTISWLDPLWTWRFLMHYVHMVYVLEVSCFKFQLSMMSGTPSKTPLSTISWLDPLPWRFHVQNFNSLLYDVKNPINLKHNLQIVYVLEVPCFKFQLSVKSWSPWKISLSTIFQKLTPKRPYFMGRNQNLIESFPNNVILGRWLIIMIKSCNL